MYGFLSVKARICVGVIKYEMLGGLNGLGVKGFVGFRNFFGRVVLGFLLFREMFVLDKK